MKHTAATLSTPGMEARRTSSTSLSPGNRFMSLWGHRGGGEKGYTCNITHCHCNDIAQGAPLVSVPWLTLHNVLNSFKTSTSLRLGLKRLICDGNRRVGLL